MTYETMKLRLNDVIVNREQKTRTLRALFEAKKTINDCDLDDCLSKFIYFLDALPTSESQGFYVTDLEIEMPDKIAYLILELTQ